MSDIFRTRIVNIRSRHHNRAWEDDESSGLFHFRHDLLEQLPVYLSFIRKMAETDPSAYAIYANAGGLLLPPNAMLGSTLSDVDPRKIPSFACAMLGSGIEQEKNDKDLIWPRLLYLQKLKSAPHVQLTRGDLYSMTMFYTRSDDHRSAPIRYHVSVGGNGDVRLMRELQTERKTMRSKHGAWREPYSIPSRQWRVPSALAHVAGEGGRDVHEMAAVTFCFLAGIAPRMAAGIQVRAHKGGPRAVFNVPIGRTPYFFKDREVTTTGSGRTKKIFHYVPGYTRMDGVLVRPHTKGLRQFVWNGYNIHIGIPGLDFPDLNNFRAKALHVDDDSPIEPGFVESADAVGEMAQAVESSSWWHSRKRRK